jgi:putative phosphoribosyl transferase
VTIALTKQTMPLVQSLQIRSGFAMLEGELTVPVASVGIVLFAHGSGNGRLSPRSQFIARRVNEAGLATLLFDLLTPLEEALDLPTGRLGFDVGFLAKRLVAATDWVKTASQTKHLRVGYFGGSTAGGAALVAAAERPGEVSAVVSRGGRPDLAGSALPHVKAPTLLLVGGRDEQLVALNKGAFNRLCCEKSLILVSDASQLFEEPGALDEVARRAADWFERWLNVRSGDAHSGS